MLITSTAKLAWVSTAKLAWVTTTKLARVSTDDSNYFKGIVSSKESEEGTDLSEDTEIMLALADVEGEVTGCKSGPSSFLIDFFVWLLPISKETEVWFVAKKS